MDIFGMFLAFLGLVGRDNQREVYIFLIIALLVMAIIETAIGAPALDSVRL